MKILPNIDEYLRRSRVFLHARIDERDRIERARSRLDGYAARDRINRLYALALRELVAQSHADRIRFGIRDRVLLRIRP